MQASGNLGEPQITNPKPSGTIAAKSTVVSVNTALAAAAQCKFDTNDVSYNSMANAMAAAADPANSGLILNSASIGNLNDGDYKYFVRCRDYLGATNTTSTVISFKVSGSGAGDAIAPQISNYYVSSSSASIGAAIKVTAKATDNQGVARVTAGIRNEAGQSYGMLTLLDNGVNGGNVAGNGIYGNIWNTTGMAAGTYFLDITAVDNFGNSVNQTNAATVTLR